MQKKNVTPAEWIFNEKDISRENLNYLESNERAVYQILTRYRVQVFKSANTDQKNISRIEVDDPANEINIPLEFRDLAIDDEIHQTVSNCNI